MSYQPSKGFLRCLGFIFIALMGSLGISPNRSFSSVSAKASDFANIRSLGQASLIYANEHNGEFPRASDVWDYMGQLAEGGDLTDAGILWSRVDPAADSVYDSPLLILTAEQSGNPRRIKPAFRQLKPSVAVALGPLKDNMPGSVPIAWTRGLQPDGTWAKHSPYGADGGYIVFVGGNIEFYRNLIDDGGRLARFNGKGKTANILEALPPGCRIGEYAPTPSEQIAWSNAPRYVHVAKIPWFKRWIPSLSQSVVIALWGLFFLLPVFMQKNGKGPALRDFTWPLVIGVILLFLFK